MPNQLHPAFVLTSDMRELENEDMDTTDNITQSTIENSDISPQSSPLDLSMKSTLFPPTNQSTSTQQSSFEVPIVKPSHVFGRQLSNKSIYAPPSIETPPKDEWHYRSIKDLSKKHIPFIAGEGPQRTPVRIRIPPKSHHEMCLGVRVTTIDRQFHDSKVIVPPRTTVEEQLLSHENNLKCLNFNACDSKDHFDMNTREIFFKIVDEEHRAQLKEVRVHMFNLYQNQTITKDKIESKRLDLCRLAFRLYKCEQGKYVPISEHSYSEIIREKKTSVRSHGSQRMNNQGISFNIDTSEFSEPGSHDGVNDYIDRFYLPC